LLRSRSSSHRPTPWTVGNASLTPLRWACRKERLRSTSAWTAPPSANGRSGVVSSHGLGGPDSASRAPAAARPYGAGRPGCCALRDVGRHAGHACQCGHHVPRPRPHWVAKQQQRWAPLSRSGGAGGVVPAGRRIRVGRSALFEQEPLQHGDDPATGLEPCGQPAVGRAPRNHGPNSSLIAL
jgi:hypothetical protein